MSQPARICTRVTGTAVGRADLETLRPRDIAFHASVKVDDQGVPIELTDVQLVENTIRLDDSYHSVLVRLRLLLLLSDLSALARGS